MQFSQSLSVWRRWILLLAALLDASWGAWMLFSPGSWYRATGLPLPVHPGAWRYGGILTISLAVGYWIASRDPIRHWAVVLVGLIGKVLAPIAFIAAVGAGTAPLTSLWTVVVADLVWWLPFGFILTAAYVAHREQPRRVSADVLQMALRTRTSKGATLAELSGEQPVLLIFLRNSGCAFCREALGDLRQQRAALEATGAIAVLVHMGDEHRMRQLLLRYGLDDLLRISDPSRVLYRAFGLERGSPLMLLSPRIWWRTFDAALIQGHGAGAMDGDPRQLPGVFLLFHEQVLHSYRHRSPADRPNYVALAREDSSPQVIW